MSFVSAFSFVVAVSSAASPVPDVSVWFVLEDEFPVSSSKLPVSVSFAFSLAETASCV